MRIEREYMEFTLFYRGNLQSKGSREHKHDIRKKIRSQLEHLLKSTHLDNFGYRGLLESGCLQKDSFRFISLVQKGFDAVAELDLTMLWPQPKGSIITNGGDIDNRLKTLFDALKMPSEPTALPPGIEPEANELPFFYCLLEDDSLITKLSVQTDQLLEVGNSTSEVVVMMKVKAYHLGGSAGSGRYL
jgi:hypothetical protein